MAALRSLSFQLSGAQLGITVTSLVVGFIVEPTVGAALDPLVQAVGVPESSSLGISVVLALILATATQMVIGELVPKNLALAKPVDLALWISGPMRFANLAFKPLILFLNNSANWTVRRLGIEPQEELNTVRSLEEIELLIQSSHHGGELEVEQFSLLTRSISFGDKDAEDALIPRTAIEAVSKEDTLEDLISRAVVTGHSRFPVMGRDIDDIVGMAHIKDIYRIPIAERRATSVAEIVQDAMVVPESRNLESMLFEMRRTRKQLAVVIDEYGGTAGIVTLEDLLEEIVGEIEDEYDAAPTTAPLESSSDGVHLVSGMLHPDELQELTGFEMPEGDYETLAGFLLSILERIPDQGEHIAYGPWEFKVVEMDGKRVARVLMTGPVVTQTGEDDQT
ncbi:MAG: HlyC/CorC family transporter [Actinobacteria bacterium]|nr:HlyC/CorC family transporter [Actinomycetota bacterium]